MSATVVQMSAFLSRVGRARASDADFVRQHIKGELQSTCGISRIAQAQARALRHISNGMEPDKAIKKVIAWAKCAVEPDPTTPTSPMAA